MFYNIQSTQEFPVKNQFIHRRVFRVKDEYIPKDVELAARLAYAAAANQPHEARVAVVSILLNRVKKKGTNIKKELYRPNQFYEVESPMFNVSVRNTVFKECYKAAYEAFTKNQLPGDFIYFMNPSESKSGQMNRILKQNKDAVFIGDLVFF